MHDENDNETAVGVIIGRLDRHLRGARLWRGYIAMLSVDPRWRGHGIGAQLIRRAVDDMVQGGAAEIVLETEVDNAAALRLYERLGFLREKRLYRFYLNGAWVCLTQAKTRSGSCCRFRRHARCLCRADAYRRRGRRGTPP